MRVNLKDAQRAPGQPVEFEGALALQPTTFAGDLLTWVEPVHVKGNAVGQGDVVLVAGEATAKVQMPCNRCAKPFVQSLHVLFDEEYAAVVDADHPDRFAIEGESTDLTPMLLDNLLMALPSKNLCGSDCKGLCPVCGADLSMGDCGCPRENASPENSLRVLGALLSDKEV